MASKYVRRVKKDLTRQRVEVLKSARKELSGSPAYNQPKRWRLSNRVYSKWDEPQIVEVRDERD
jgi:hypothetical protein